MTEPGKGLERQKNQKNQSPQGKNYLLAIAINDYQYCSKLSNAVRDVEAFIEVMTTRYKFYKEDTISIFNQDATKENIERTLDGLIDTITSDDNLVIYFSGHGCYNERRGGYWIPVDAQENDTWTKYISNDTIKNHLNNIKSFHTFLIVDSCFAGSLFIDKTKEKSTSDNRDTVPSRWGLTSGKKEIVSDGHPGTHSPFAAVLLDVLRRADQPPGVMHICDQVLEKVAANAEQTPMASPLRVLGHQGGQMVLHFREDEKTIWQATLQANTRYAYYNFYRKYPHSKYAEEALAKIGTLKETQIWRQVPKDDEEALLRFIKENPTSFHVTKAQLLIEKLLAYDVPDHMVLVKGGSFQMGDWKGTNLLTIRDFMIAKFPLTFREYDAYCEATGRNLPKDSKWGRDERPVVNVNWFDAVNYCNWRSQQEGLQEVYQQEGKQLIPNWQANGYRLPTEAEWEYAARGGQHSQGFEFAGSNNVDEVAWYWGNSEAQTHPVGLKKANELGIYDLSGNVWEWCGNFHSTVVMDDSIDTNEINYAIRGGSWYFLANNARVTARNTRSRNRCSNHIGFRLARTIAV